MHGEPPDKLHVVEGHFQLLGPASVILVGKNGLCGTDVQYPVVGDGDFVGIAPQVFEHGLWMPERPLGIDHPFFLEQGIDEFLAGIGPGFKPLHTVGKSQGIDGEFKIGIRRGVVLPFDQIEVIIDLLGIDLGRQFVEMQGQLCKVVGLIAQGAFTSAYHGDFLAELLVKFPKSCYIGTGLLDKVCFFFMIKVDV